MVTVIGVIRHVIHVVLGRWIVVYVCQGFLKSSMIREGVLSVHNHV